MSGETTLPRVHTFCDGACSPNPGLGRLELAARRAAP
jgi:ribonuclease HI